MPGRSSSAGAEPLIDLLTWTAVASEVCAWEDGFEARGRFGLYCLICVMSISNVYNSKTAILILFKYQRPNS